MEDKWKEIFKSNREFFREEFQVPSGHEERFLAKLNADPNPGKTFQVNYWKATAVLVPLLMLSAYFFLEFNPLKTRSEKVELADYSQGLGEAENYLAFVVKEKTKEINQLKTSENRDLINHSLNELDSLQSNYNQLLMDLKESGGNPQVIKSVVMNLQLQVEVLESVMKQLEFKQEIKNNFNDSNRI